MARTVTLDPHSEQLLEEALSSGEYGSAEEVVARALEALHAKPVLEQERRQAVQNLLASLGEGVRTKDLLHEGHKY